MKKIPDDYIHTTIGVYKDDSFVTNGVKHSNLQWHIKYNIKYRFGRALFVDGKCVHKGYLDDDRIKEWERNIKGGMFNQYKDTAPYM